MSIEISFKTDNAAFEYSYNEEVCRILDEIKAKVMNGAQGGLIRDVNGNSIGEWHDDAIEQ